jgi:2-methylaconitate cis-trans-isomerase PrpF
MVPGVSGQGAPVRLEFQYPGGAATGRLLPTGDPVNVLDVVGVGPLEVSMVDAGNPCVFIAADALGLVGTEMPDVLDGQLELLNQLEAIRCSASVAMGISDSMKSAAKIPGIPKVALVSPAQSAATLSGDRLDESECDITLRMISVGQPHRAIPVTGSMCAAIAAQITDTVVNRLCRPAAAPDDIRIAHPSGVARVGATVTQQKGKWVADNAVLYRTARRLMDGHVYVSAARTPGLSAD